MGEPFYGDVHLVSDYGRVSGELEFDGLLLWPRFHLDFGGPGRGRITRRRVRLLHGS